MGDHEEMSLAAEVAENVDTVSTEEITGQEELAEHEEQIQQQSEEHVVKTYTQEEVDRIVGERLARERKKITRENDQKYGELEHVLKSGTGKSNVEEITEAFREHYQSKGVKIPNRATFNDTDVATLAKADAAEIISLGLDEVVEEVNKMAQKGVQNMTPRERLTFTELCEHRKAQESRNELAKLGVKSDVYDSKEFKEYAAMFNSDTPITKIYEMYAKNNSPQTETIGSLKNGAGPEEKTYYTPEEVDKLTEKDWDNPVIFARVRESMKHWK